WGNRQRRPVRPIGRPARIDRGDPIDRVEGDRHQQIDPEHERDAKPPQAMAKKRLPSPALNARPDKNAGKKEHQLHQKQKRKGTKQVEAEPTLIVDDRKGPPIIRGRVEGERVRGLVDDVGRNAVKGQNPQNCHPPQISERQAGFGHGLKSQYEEEAVSESASLIEDNHKTAAEFHTGHTWLKISNWGRLPHPAGAERNLVSRSLSGAPTSGRRR